MNPWQVSHQLQSTLAAATWPDSPAQTAFGAVAVTTKEAFELNTEARLPVAIVTPGGETHDREIPDRINARFSIYVACEVPQDRLGSASIIGGSRAVGIGSSGGRGVQELEEVAAGAILAMPAALRLNARLSDGRAVRFASCAERVLVEREFDVEVTSRRDRFYHPVRVLVAADGGSHRLSLTWKDPPVRWDMLGGATGAGVAVILIVYKAGATPPASPTDGTQVTTTLGGTALVATGAGQKSVSVYVQYDENGDGTAERWSAAATGTVTVA